MDPLGINKIAVAQVPRPCPNQPPFHPLKSVAILNSSANSTPLQTAGNAPVLNLKKTAPTTGRLLSANLFLTVWLPNLCGVHIPSAWLSIASPSGHSLWSNQNIMTTISIPIQCILHPHAKCFALTVLIQTHIPASVHAGMVHIQTTQPAAVHLNMFVGTIFIQTHIPTAVQMLVHGQDTIAQPAITSTP
jgi:hypothetical protein